MTQPRRKVYESEIEDYLEKHPEAFLPYSDNAILLGRQIQLPHGRLDLLIYDESIYIVELKAVPLKPRDVCQVLRYQRDIRDLIWSTSQWENDQIPQRRLYAGRAGKEFDRVYAEKTTGKPDTFVFPVTVPVLIGPHSNESVVSAMMAVGGRVFEFETDGDDSFVFEEHFGEVSIYDPQYWPDPLPSWLIEYLSIVVQEASKEAKIEQDLLAFRLFGSFALGNQGGE